MAGERDVPSDAQLLTNPNGKILRLNFDGTVPTDNPFYDGDGPNDDAIWAYGSPGVYDLAREYNFSPDVAEKIRYTGYLRRTPDDNATTNCAAVDPVECLDIPTTADVALCMVGGGQDGADIALNFARAVLPENTIGVVVTGPFMPP